MNNKIYDLIQKSIINLEKNELEILYNYWNSDEKKR